MKLVENVCLDVILENFKNGSCWVKNSVSRSNLRKTLLINTIPHNPESSGERLQGHHDPLVLMYKIRPLPFSMACRKRRLKSETKGCFPRNL